MTVLGSATVDDGYNGHTCRVTLSYTKGYIMELHDAGKHRGPIPQCANIDEAIWMLKHYPAARSRYSALRWHEAIA
jgi:hypothetical protein